MTKQNFNVKPFFFLLFYFILFFAIIISFRGVVSVSVCAKTIFLQPFPPTSIFYFYHEFPFNQL